MKSLISRNLEDVKCSLRNFIFLNEVVLPWMPNCSLSHAETWITCLACLPLILIYLRFWEILPCHLLMVLLFFGLCLIQFKSFSKSLVCFVSFFSFCFKLSFLFHCPPLGKLHPAFSVFCNSLRLLSCTLFQMQIPQLFFFLLCSICLSSCSLSSSGFISQMSSVLHQSLFHKCMSRVLCLLFALSQFLSSGAFELLLIMYGLCLLQWLSWKGWFSGAGKSGFPLLKVLRSWGNFVDLHSIQSLCK